MPDTSYSNELVTISKIVPGGQGLASLADGKRVFVWNALPGERVRLRLIKQRRTYAEAIAEEVLEPSPERVTPQDANYLATSPWQMMTFAAENSYKRRIVSDIFQQAHITLPESLPLVVSEEGQPETRIRSTARRDEKPRTSVSYAYRNKVEYGFWGDDDGLHLAAYQRGSHGKQIVTGSSLTMPELDAAANAVCRLLDTMRIRAGELKTIIVRCDQQGGCAASLFVKSDGFPRLALPDGLRGLRVYFSNPKSPASVPTRRLQELGDCMLTDTLLGKAFRYDVDSFFQVNLPVFELALQAIADQMSADSLTDMYAGVGSIGLSVAKREAMLVELDPATAAMARLNFAASGLAGQVIEAPAEKVLAYITGDGPIVFDPPRAGMHDKVTAKVLEALPPQIVYLSCNPITQARDIALLQDTYAIDYFEAFNFFPRTPHIETLAVLRRRS